MKVYLYRFLQFLRSRGVSDRHLEDNNTTSLLNVLGFFSFLACWSVFFLTMAISGDVIYLIITGTIGCMYIGIVILHHFHRVRLAKFYFACVIPIWYFAALFLIGGYFSQSIASVATIAVTYVLFRNEPKLRYQLIVYNCLIYIIPTIYLNFYEPVLGHHDYPLDEILVYLLSIGWISIVFLVYEENTLGYIKSLQEKNEQLQRKTNELQRFTYIASHDLKSPIRNMTSFLNLIRRAINRKDYQGIEEYLAFAQTGVQEMHELVSGVLEVSRIEQNAKTRYAMQDLNKLLRKAISNIQAEIDQKQANITATILPCYYCHESDFIIVFQNLVQNAIKYNRSSEPQLQITSTQNNDTLLLSFKDNGIGIESQFYDQIFDYFKRLHSSQQYQGTGLGLGLCRKIIEKYDGQIRVESDPGRYAEFIIELPL